MPSVCVILPAFNEAKHIEECLRATQTAFPDAAIVVVDNNSTDNTAELANAGGATVITEPRPGKGRAVCTGVRHALAEDYEWVAFHDSDNEYNAEHLADLVAQCDLWDGHVSDVMGVGCREVTLGRVLWRSLLANFVARTALKVALKSAPPVDILTGARVLSAALAKKLFVGSHPYRGFELETALTRKAMRAHATMVASPVRYEPRAVKEKKIKASDMVGILRAAWQA